MNLDVDKQVLKDKEKLPKYVQLLAAKELKNLIAAGSINELENVRHLKGTKKPYYRLSFNDYRFMLYYETETDTVEVLSLTHRKDSYKKHNLPWRK